MGYFSIMDCARRLEAAVFIAGCVRTADAPGNGRGGRDGRPETGFSAVSATPIGCAWHGQQLGGESPL